MRRILEIWASGQGVISVHCFQSSVPAEAYTRESCVVEALGERGRGGGDGSRDQLYHLSVSLCTEQGGAACPGAHGEFGVPGHQHGVWAQAPRPKPPSPAGKRCLGAGANGDPTGLRVLTGSVGLGMRVLSPSRGAEGAEPVPAGLRTITNQRKGNCYGAAASWLPERRRRLGVHMLHRAMRIFLAEGERQLRPADIQAGR